MTQAIKLTPAAFDAARNATTLRDSKSLDAARLVLVHGWSVTDAAIKHNTTRQYCGTVVKTIKKAALGQGRCPMCGNHLRSER